ncbi:MAG: hypothetical protein DMG59_29265 [Acidobacteria bacterium]|nr:MAG: hypothetical protein DMG59_29265 [Acidobacteriota bacterium]
MVDARGATWLPIHPETDINRDDFAQIGQERHGGYLQLGGITQRGKSAGKGLALGRQSLLAEDRFIAGDARAVDGPFCM